MAPQGRGASAQGTYDQADGMAGAGRPAAARGAPAGVVRGRPAPPSSSAKRQLGCCLGHSRPRPTPRLGRGTRQYTITRSELSEWNRQNNLLGFFCVDFCDPSDESVRYICCVLFFVVTGRPVAPVDFVLLVFSAQNNSNAQMTLRHSSDSRFHSNSSLRVGADVSTTPLESLHWMWYL